MNRKQIPTLLYLANPENWRFATAIKFNTQKYNSKLVREVSPGFADLNDCDGVVFLGSQTSQRYPHDSVLGDSEPYFYFVDAIHNRGQKVIAVLKPKINLPGRNAKIDKVIRITRDDTIQLIVEEIEDYFEDHI